MDRQALIEAIAQDYCGGTVGKSLFAQDCWARVEKRIVPAVVGFVGKWLQRMEDERVSDCQMGGVIERWVEEMGGAGEGEG